MRLKDHLIMDMKQSNNWCFSGEAHNFSLSVFVQSVLCFCYSFLILVKFEIVFCQLQVLR